MIEISIKCASSYYRLLLNLPVLLKVQLRLQKYPLSKFTTEMSYPGYPLYREIKNVRDLLIIFVIFQSSVFHLGPPLPLKCDSHGDSLNL